MKKYKGLIGFFAVFFIFVLLLLALYLVPAISSVFSSSSPYKEQEADTAGYEISDMRVKMDVKADRSIRVEERITLKFHYTSHGFYRDIPVNSGEKLRDVSVEGLTDFNKALKVSHESRSLIRIRIGDPDKTLLNPFAPKTCIIRYTLVTPKVKKYPDTLMLNVIGHGFTTNIKNAEVDISLPANINAGEELYYIGSYGSIHDAVDSNRITVQQSDKSVKIKVNTMHYGAVETALPPFSGLTIYYGMPAGTFGVYVDYQFFVMLAVMLLLVGAAITLKLIFGKNKPLNEITNFYPPVSKITGKPYSPAEMGYLIDGAISNSDISSLIFYFASKGLLRLEKCGKETKLIKTKGKSSVLSPAEKKLYKKIFAGGDETNLSSLSFALSSEFMGVSVEVKAKYGAKMYDKKAKTAGLVLAAVAFFLTVALTFLSYMRIYPLYFNFIGLLALLPIAVCYIFGSHLVRHWFKYGTKRKFVFAAYIAVAVLTVLMFLFMLKRDVIGWAEGVFMGGAVGIIVLLLPFISKRQDEYNEVLGEILGFRSFLLLCEKEKLEMLLEQSPEYFYDILPYAQVLGVSKVWIDKFKGIELSPPSYYEGGLFDLYLFTSFYRSSCSAFSAAALPKPSESSHSGGGGGFGGFGGGGGGGGGFSGGGFGGGGGGRF